MRQIKILLLILASTLLLSACNNEDKTAEAVNQAVAIESGDECHVCGMIITRFPGPKGESFSRYDKKVRKYCSTRDLFAFVLEPENSASVSDIYVHDMAVTPWDHPDDKTLIDAKKAYYVINHSLKGAMGATLASFKQQADAEAFAKKYQGSVIRFEQVDMPLLQSLKVAGGTGETMKHH